MPATKRPQASFIHSYGPPSCVNALPSSAIETRVGKQEEHREQPDQPGERLSAVARHLAERVEARHGADKEQEHVEAAQALNELGLLNRMPASSFARPGRGGLCHRQALPEDGREDQNDHNVPRGSRRNSDMRGEQIIEERLSKSDRDARLKPAAIHAGSSRRCGAWSLDEFKDVPVWVGDVAAGDPVPGATRIMQDHGLARYLARLRALDAFQRGLEVIHTQRDVRAAGSLLRARIGRPAGRMYMISSMIRPSPASRSAISSSTESSPIREAMSGPVSVTRLTSRRPSRPHQNSTARSRSATVRPT